MNQQCLLFHETRNDQLKIPKHSDGTDFTIDKLFDDQLAIVTVVMDKIKEWVECTDYSRFSPLRMTINGPAGTGKTIVINTLVSLIRNLFQDNDVAQVCAPTGAAAFNAGGGTLHHLMSNTPRQVNYEPFSMSTTKQEKLAAQFKHLLCLIIDERSLLDSTLLGISEQMMSETIFDGALPHESWGKLPILILVGDDYQLPSIGEGAFDVFSSSGWGVSKMTLSGRGVLQECANCVMSLKTSKQIQKKRTKDKQLLQQLRLASELNEEQIQKLLSLHIDEIKASHGVTAVSEIKSKSIYLYYRNHKRIFKNLQRLVEHSNPENPVAVCRTKSDGQFHGKAIKKHFERSEIPSSSLLAVESKVAIENKNFCPQWGLHNGAVGTVKEIVFAEGTSPNAGDLPQYIVVEFLNYIGPVWDEQNPKV